MDTADSVACPRFPAGTQNLSAQIQAKMTELVELIIQEASARSNKDLIKHAAILHKENQELREQIQLKQETAGES